MTHEVLSAIAGIGLYPTLSLVLFFTLFVGMLWRVSRMRPREADEMGALPLHDGTIDIHLERAGSPAADRPGDAR